MVPHAALRVILLHTVSQKVPRWSTFCHFSRMRMASEISPLIIFIQTLGNRLSITVIFLFPHLSFYTKSLSEDDPKFITNMNVHLPFSSLEPITLSSRILLLLNTHRCWSVFPYNKFQSKSMPSRAEYCLEGLHAACSVQQQGLCGLFSGAATWSCKTR